MSEVKNINEWYYVIHACEFRLLSLFFSLNLKAKTATEQE